MIEYMDKLNTSKIGILVAGVTLFAGISAMIINKINPEPCEVKEEEDEYSDSEDMDESTKDSAVQPESTNENTNESAEPVAEPVAEPPQEPVAEPHQEPAAELPQEPVAEPPQEPAAELPQEPVQVPVAELPQEPVQVPAAEPVQVLQEPVSGPVTGAVAPQPVAQEVPKQPLENRMQGGGVQRFTCKDCQRRMKRTKKYKK